MTLPWLRLASCTSSAFHMWIISIVIDGSGLRREYNSLHTSILEVLSPLSPEHVNVKKTYSCIHEYSRHVRSIQSLAIVRPKLSGRRLSSTVLNQVCHGPPVLRRQSLGGPRMQAGLIEELENGLDFRCRHDKCGQRKTGTADGW